MFPKLLEEVAKKREELKQPLRFPNAESRFSEEYRNELLEKTAGKIGGTPEEQKRFFDGVVGAGDLLDLAGDLLNLGVALI